MAEMDETELKAIVASEIRAALGYFGSGISAERADNWDRYFAKPYGNEREGRSQVVSTDVMDTIEWIMPSLMRIFASGDEVVRFEPVGPEDEETAQAATDLVNHAFTKDNEGFLVLQTWFKDALVAKNGVVKFWWDETEEWKRERYSGLSEDAFAQLLADDEIELVEHTETQAIAVDPMTGQPAPVTTHDAVFKRRKQRGRVKIAPVPPEEFLIDARAIGIEDARFIGHRRAYTVSELRSEGVSEDVIERLPKGQEGAGIDDESIARQRWGDDGGPFGADSDTNNEAMREVWVTEAYMRVDYDGDGIAEMRRIRVAGAESELLANEPWDCSVPFAAITPIPIPHKFTGISVADLVKDLQLVKTTVQRQYLDGLYIANNPRMEVKEDQIVDPAEVMDSKAGGLVRSKGVGPALLPIQVPFIGPAALQGLEYIDTLRENRTGVTRYNQGVDANSLNKTAQGVNQIMTAAQQRIELIARTFAETGVKALFKGILELIVRYQDKARAVRLRGKWVEIDPREWRNEFDTTVTVGLGNGNRDMMFAQLGQVLGIQMQAVQFQGGVQGPFVTGKNLYNTVEKMVQALGLKTAEPYFTDPSTQPPQQPKPDPEMVKAQAQMQIEAQKAQQASALESQKAQQQAQTEMVQAQADAETMRFKAQVDAEIARMKANLDMELARQKAELDLELKTRLAEVTASVQAQKAARDADRADAVTARDG